MTFRPFDVLTVPLEGTSLVEASAGTGKTYTITHLFLRLLLERGLAVDQILVVTFTEAATEELKERIRNRLKEALQAFSEGRSPDPLLAAMVVEYGSKTRARRNLSEALRAFDQAAISTIHGFCWRTLRQNAFESRSLFDTQMMADQRALKEEIVEDFWRQHCYNESLLFVRYLLDRNVRPSTLMDLCRYHASSPFMKIVPAVTAPDTTSLEQAFLEATRELIRTWSHHRDGVVALLQSHPSLNRNRYRKKSVSQWIDAMDGWIASEGRSSLLFDSFYKFTAKELAVSTRKGCEPPKHPCFDLCQSLQECYERLLAGFDARLLALKGELFRYLHGELIGRKARRNVQSFDDLLSRFHEALQGRAGMALARAIRGRYRAALVDEFQDTDPIQTAIIKGIFQVRGSALFLIGDPKQAIYGFRGADIFAYLKAAETAEEKYTLGKNWRSSAGLIAAVNTVFSNKPEPFVFDDIAFHEMAAAKEDADRLLIDGQRESPFHVWFVSRESTTGEDRPIPQYVAKRAICQAVSREIARLVHLGRQGRAALGGKALTEGDVAILVRTNDEARLTQEALSTAHVASVVYSAENLFDSREALEVERVLAAVSEPNHEKRLKAALTTDLMGVTGEQLDELTRVETLWEERVVRFSTYRTLWLEKGFIQMFRVLLSEEAVIPRLMAWEDGERRCTNTLHLAEVLQQASVDAKLGMAGLLKWLSEQRDPNAPRLDEYQIRLEKDEDAVKIVTIHRSKGLEFPIVFCPFSWGGSTIKGKNRPFTFHDPTDQLRLTLDLGSSSLIENRLLAEREMLAENLRLLYVALTRAKHRCYFVWGRFKGTETSAPAYLFHGPFDGGRDLKEDPLSSVSRRLETLTDEAMRKDLERVAEKAHGAITIYDMPIAPVQDVGRSGGEEIGLVCREFAGKIDRTWWISSFSSLISGQLRHADLADHDTVLKSEAGREAVSLDTADEPAQEGFFAFPRGALAGTFVHDVFENIDFSDGKGLDLEPLVAEKLPTYGFDRSWTDATCGMIRRVLSVPLEPDRPTFTLSRIEKDQRLNELAFYFPLKKVTAPELGELLNRTMQSSHVMGNSERFERLHFSPTQGFLRGFIDLAFQFEGRYYLVDWKSNHLGDHIQDYNQAALAQTMTDAFYTLQYLLYAVALDQYLRFRIPGYDYEEHFGAVYYIFVRGVDADTGLEYGVFRDRPSQALIKELSDRLVGRD